MRMRKRHPVSKLDNQWLRQTSLGSRISLASLIQTLAVAEYLNFRHAADALGISQSSVSARIGALEQELGILLFERNTRGVKLTVAGRRFIERVTAGVEHLDIAVKSVGMAATGERGRLRIGVHGLITGSFLDNLLAEYRKSYPQIAIKMIEATARDAVMYLRTDRIDVAFVVGEPNLPDCHSRPIWTEQLMAVLAADHRLAHQTNVSWEQLVSERFLVRHSGTGPQVHDHIVLRLAGRWPAPEIQRHDVERSTLLSMVAQGFGITLLGSASGLSPTTGVAFLPILDEPGPIIFSAVWSPKDRSPTLRNLFKLADIIGRNSGQT